MRVMRKLEPVFMLRLLYVLYSHPAPFGGGGEKYPILMCKITDTSQRRSHKFIQK